MKPSAACADRTGSSRPAPSGRLDGLQIHLRRPPVREPRISDTLCASATRDDEGCGLEGTSDRGQPRAGPAKNKIGVHSPWEMQLADRRSPGGVSFRPSGVFASVDDHKSPPEEGPPLPESGRTQDKWLPRIEFALAIRGSWGAEPSEGRSQQAMRVANK